MVKKYTGVREVHHFEWRCQSCGRVNHDPAPPEVGDEIACEACNNRHEVTEVQYL